MNCWRAAERIVELIQTDQQAEIIELLEEYSFEQRQYIMSIKYELSSFLFMAVRNEFEVLISYFVVSCGADPNSIGLLCRRKFSCLDVTLMQNSNDALSNFLKLGADTELVFTGDQTPLHYACRVGLIEMTRILIEHGANVHNVDDRGITCLMDSIHSYPLCQYLLSTGVNVNRTNYLGETALLQAIKAEENEVVSLLLDDENTDVKLKNNFGEDAMHYAVKFTSKHIRRIMRKGSYTIADVTDVYEMQSCMYYIECKYKEAKLLWMSALELQHEVMCIPLFSNPFPLGEIKEVLEYFNFDDVAPMSYLETVSGLQSVFTLAAFAKAVNNVLDAENVSLLSIFFFKIVHSLDDEDFFRAIHDVQMLIWHFFDVSKGIELLTLKALKFLVEYLEEIHSRLKRMSPLERISKVLNIESFLNLVIKIFELLHSIFSQKIHLFYEEIKRIIYLDLRGLSQKTLLHLCAEKSKVHLIDAFFFECRANLNSTDNEGISALHLLVDHRSTFMGITQKMIDNGFDFRLVKYDGYCLPCEMKRKWLLQTPVKHVSLQCLAAKKFCKKVMNSFNDVPYHLLAIIKSHLYL